MTNNSLMTNNNVSDALLEAFEEGFENIVRRYPGSGTKAKLRLVRTVLGLTQKQFADELGVSFATVRNWEQPDRAEPSGAAKTLIDLLAEDPATVRRLLKTSRASASRSAAELAGVV